MTPSVRIKTKDSGLTDTQVLESLESGMHFISNHDPKNRMLCIGIIMENDEGRKGRARIAYNTHTRRLCSVRFISEDNADSYIKKNEENIYIYKEKSDDRGQCFK